MRRWLSPHPNGWDVKPEVPGNLASRGTAYSRPLLATTVVNTEGSFKSKSNQSQDHHFLGQNKLKSKWRDFMQIIMGAQSTVNSL